MPTFKLNKPPFSLQPQEPADQVAAEFIAAFALTENLDAPVTRTYEAILQAIGASAENPLAIAGKNLGRDIDSGIGAGLGNGYHTRPHFCEVMLSACFLSLLEALETDTQLMVIFAAMAHDFHHDGTMNGPTPFRLERLAFSEALPYLRSAGVGEDTQQEIGALILSTDVLHGTPVARASAAYHHGMGHPPDIPPAAPELALLLDSPGLTRMALLICEADILPSVGLTVDHALHVQACLAREWGKPLKLEDKLQFIQKYFPGFIVGRFFQSNVERILCALQERIAASR
jgi:hypothetical protein